VLLGCASFTPGSDSSINIAGFCDKQIDAMMQQAITTGQTDPTAANAQWAKLDQALMQQAAWAPMFTPKLIDFVSKRVGNYQFSKQFYMLLGQLWVQ
jgi:peptide/nickel transport system substrate-binding protein